MMENRPPDNAEDQLESPETSPAAASEAVVGEPSAIGDPATAEAGPAPSGTMPGDGTDAGDVAFEETFPPPELAATGEAGEMDINLDREMDEGQPVDAPAAEKLEPARAALVRTMFARDRPGAAEAAAALEEYAAALAAAIGSGLLTAADEVATLGEMVRSENQLFLDRERAHFEQIEGLILQHVGAYDLVFTELSVFAREVGQELKQCNPESELLQSATAELRAQLSNHRKGIEIIHRMLSRAFDRRQELAAGPPRPLEEQLEEPCLPAEAGEVRAYVEECSNRFHKLRDRNYHAVQDAQTYADKCRSQLLQTVKSVLTAVDGIDGGLENGEATQARLMTLCDAGTDIGQVVQSWMGAYARLGAHADTFFMRTGIEPRTVEAGTPFNPETMEPQGTVADPERNNEDVAAVMRRGYWLGGEMVRPILVDVVRNPG